MLIIISYGNFGYSNLCYVMSKSFKQTVVAHKSIKKPMPISKYIVRPSKPIFCQPFMSTPFFS